MTDKEILDALYDTEDKLTVANAEIERLTAEVEMLRGVGCEEDGDGPCGVCIKCKPAQERRAVVAVMKREANACDSSDAEYEAGPILRWLANRIEAGMHL